VFTASQIDLALDVAVFGRAEKVLSISQKVIIATAAAGECVCVLFVCENRRFRCVALRIILVRESQSAALRSQRPQHHNGLSAPVG